MELLEEFINDRCIIEEGQKVLSSSLFGAYQKYLKSKNKPYSYIISNKIFTQTFNKKYGDYCPKTRANIGMVFNNITLKEDYIKPEPIKHKSIKTATQKKIIIIGYITS